MNRYCVAADKHEARTGTIPFGRVVLGSLSSSKKGCVRAPRAVILVTGL